MKRKDTSRVIIKSASYDENLENTVSAVFDELAVGLTGKKVLVKPNILGPFLPEKGVTTNPLLVRSIVRQLKIRGAEDIIVGDNPGTEGYGAVKRAAETSGIAEASEGCYRDIGKSPVIYKTESRFFNEVLISKEILEADIVINVPKLKTHVLTGMSGAVKNTFGYLVGGDKIRKHSLAKTPEKFAELLIDIYRIRPPEINIMDAIDIMEGNGPQRGTLRTVNKVIACTDAVTLDAFALHLLGIKMKSVPYMTAARKRGLGETDINCIEVRGEYDAVKNFRLPSTLKSNILGVLWNGLLSRFVNTTPAIDPDKCKVCRICIKHCPGKAVELAGKYPEINKRKCLNCYCCHELCMEGAIRLKGIIIDRKKEMERSKA